MSYFSILYLLAFLPLVIIIYNILPRKIRPIILLIASFIFYFIYSKWLVIYLLLSILSIYLAGLLMKHVNDRRDKALNEEIEDKKKIKTKYKNINKLILLVTIIFNVAFLFYFKYLNFFQSIFHLKNKIIKHLAPIGISF